MSIVISQNYPTNITRQPGLVDVKGGQLGLMELGTLTGSYGATDTQLWALFPRKPTRYIIDPDVNAETLNILLPSIDNTNYSDAHEGNLIYIYNLGGVESIDVKNAGGTPLYTITPGSFAEFVACLGAIGDWIITDYDGAPSTSQTLQQTYDNSVPAQIQVNAAPNGPLYIISPASNAAGLLMQIAGATGATPAGNYLSVFSAGASTQGTITGLGAPSPTSAAVNSIIIGPSAIGNFANCFIIGLNSGAFGPNALAIGEGTSANTDSVTLGHNCAAIAPNSVMIGYNSATIQANSINIGNSNVCYDLNDMIIGNNNNAHVANVKIIGDNIECAQVGTTVINDNVAITADTQSKHLLSYANGFQLIGDTVINTRVPPGSTTINNSPSWRTIQTQTVTSTDVQTTLMAIPMVVNSQVGIHGNLIGSRADGIGWYYDFITKVKDIGGTVTVGLVQATTEKDNSSTDIFVVAGVNEVLIQVKSTINQTIVWNLTTQLNELNFG